MFVNTDQFNLELLTIRVLDQERSQSPVPRRRSAIEPIGRRECTDRRRHQTGTGNGLRPGRERHHRYEATIDLHRSISHSVHLQVTRWSPMARCLSPFGTI